MLRPTARQKSPRMEPKREIPLRLCKPQNIVELRTDEGLEGVGSTEHDAPGLDGVKSLPDHGDDGSRSHVLDEAREEGLSLVISIVCGRRQCQRAMS